MAQTNVLVRCVEIRERSVTIRVNGASEVVELRLSVGQRPCDGEYDAWIECMGAVSECLAMPGVFCPDEYSALGACDGGRS